MINEGTTERFHALAAADVMAGGGTPILSIFRGTRRPDPIAIRMMGGIRSARRPSRRWRRDWLVVVALTDAGDRAPDFGKLRCFRAATR